MGNRVASAVRIIGATLVAVLILESSLLGGTTPAMAATDCSRFIADVNYPAGSQVEAGQTFDKDWRLTNCGDTAWAGYRVARITGSFGPESAAAPNLGQGQTGDVSVRFAAPSELGLHRATYQVQGSRGRLGDQFSIEINVVAQPQATDEPDREIAAGQTLAGAINPGKDVDSYFFAGVAGQTVTIRMTRTNDKLDPYVRLYAPTGALVAQDDDSGGSHNAMLSRLTLTQTGAYRIGAASYAGETAGAYTLSLSIEGAIQSTQSTQSTQSADESDGELSSGQTASGVISPAADVDSFYFSAPAGQVATIRMTRTGGNLDPYLRVYGPSGALIAQDDDSGGNYNALLRRLALPTAGRYRIVAGSYGGETAGAYTLSLNLETSAQVAGEFKFPWDNSRTLAFTGGPHAWTGSTRSGLDFSSSSQSTHILAMAGGVVLSTTNAECRNGACKAVKVRHDNGYEVWYVHLSSIAPGIQATGRVEQGQWLGNEGMTGATAVHIHLELRRDGVPVPWSSVTIDGWQAHDNCQGYVAGSNPAQAGASCSECNYNYYLSQGTNQIVPADGSRGTPRPIWLRSSNRER